MCVYVCVYVLFFKLNVKTINVTFSLQQLADIANILPNNFRILRSVLTGLILPSSLF